MNFLATINNEMLYEAAYQAVSSIGAEPADPIPSTGGEDFSVFMQERPAFSTGWAREMKKMTAFIRGTVLILKRTRGALP